MTISIVIPVFNKEHYLAESIASLKNQTYTDVEIIIVDDASTDHSADIARNMASKDPRIQQGHTHRPKNGNPCFHWQVCDFSGPR